MDTTTFLSNIKGYIYSMLCFKNNMEIIGRIKAVHLSIIYQPLLAQILQSMCLDLTPL